MKAQIFKPLMLSLAMMLIAMCSLFAQQNNQSYYAVSGTIKDARTKKAIPFASIYVPGTYMGTVANLDGQFTLKIAKDLNAKEFAISHMGYSVKTYAIAPYMNKNNEFLLEPASVQLQEVVVRPDDAKGIVLMAINRVSENYPTSPMNLTGFYRETIRQRRNYVSISEAVVGIYQAPYTPRRTQDRTKIIQGRKSADVKRADTLAMKLQGGPYVSMLLDVVKNPDFLFTKEHMDYYTYELEDVVKVNGEMNYVINFRPNVVLSIPLYIGKFFISVENLAVNMVEFSMDLSDKEKAANMLVLRKPASLRVEPINTRYLVSYKEINGTYYLNYVRCEVEFFADWRRRIFRTNYSIMSELAITERHLENIANIPARESVGSRTILEDLVSVYFDENFWGDYNTIEPDETIESAIRKMNRRLTP